MSLTVSLGLGQFHEAAQGDPAPMLAMLQSLVGGGYTTLVREVVAADRETLADARVVEVSRDGVRWLDGDAAAKVLDAVRTVHAAHGTHDTYAWDELEGLGAFNVQDLALTLDGATAPPGLERVAVGAHELRLIDLDASSGNWPKDTAASAFHAVAQTNRLVVHSG